MIYLDNAATTKPNDEAVKFALKYTEDYFNPSALYKQGIKLKSFLTEAADYITKTIAPSGYECVFVSCGSEADNTAIFSSVKRGNAVTTSGEHAAVYEPFLALKQRGVETRFAALNKDGSVNVEHLLSLVDDKTSFVSVVHVNNETGAINDVNAIAALVKKKAPKAIFHSDGVQAYGKIPFTIGDNIDYYSISAHKIGGMKGTGALIKKKKICLHPLIYGGGQENGMRSGTENVFGIACFYKAAEIKYSDVVENFEKVKGLKKTFLSKLDGVTVISGENASPYIVSLSADGLKGEVLQHILEEKDIIVGTGSACSSRNHYSRVLKECGYSSGVLEGVLRISFTSDTTEKEVLTAAEAINSATHNLRKIMK